MGERVQCLAVFVVGQKKKKVHNFSRGQLNGPPRYQRYQENNHNYPSDLFKLAIKKTLKKKTTRAFKMNSAIDRVKQNRIKINK